jgi:putative ABC transport system permease protein
MKLSQRLREPLLLRHLLFRQWRNRPGRALTTVASVAVAVGAVVATWVAADASRAGYRRLTEAIAGVPSVDVSARAGGRWDATLLPPLVDLSGVRAVVPLFYRPTLLRVGEKRVREIAVGVDVQQLVATGLLKMHSGEACTRASEVVLSSSLAEGLGKKIGDEVLFFARRGVRRLTIVGLAEPESMRWFAEGAGVIMEIVSLEDLSNAFGTIDRVRVAIESSASRDQVLAGVAARLPASLVAEVPAGRASLAEDVLHSSDLGLDFVTGLTVAMAWFIVGNAMLMNITERRRSLALVRVIGGTAGQMRRFVVGEAAILGGLGAVLGAAAGLAAAGPISAGISRALQAPAASLLVHPLVVPVSILLGTAVAVAAAWWPASLAVATDPLEALSQSPPKPAAGVSWKLIATAIVLWGVAGAILVLVIAEILPPRASVPAGIAMTLAFVAMTPVVLPFLARMCARLIPSRWHLEGTLALEQILRQPIRTALTTGVLVVAVSNGIGLGHAIRDNVDDVLGWYVRMLRADWVLTGTGQAPAAVPNISAGKGAIGTETGSMEKALAGLPDIERVEAIGITMGRVAGGACVIVSRDIPDTLPLPLNPIKATEAEVRSALARGEALAGTALARRTGIQPGDTVAVEVFGRTAEVKVAALAVDYTSGGSSLHLRRDAAQKLFGVRAADIWLVTAKPGTAASLREPLQEIAEHNSMLLRSLGDLKAFIDRIIGGVVGSLWAILGLGFVVGSLGVANTVTMNVLEKKRTLGLLRAVGMTSRQVTRMVVLESILLGVAGGLIGLVGGMSTALYIQLASQPLLGHPIRISFRPSVVAVNLGAAIIVTALAAWIPARRASRLDLLEALSSE